MKTSCCLSLLALFLSTASLLAAEPVVANFDDGARPKNWTVNAGHWEVKDGVLVCRELEKDQHAAASRWQIPLSDGIVKCRLKFEGATAFHIGFDPAPGQLKKQGHLYSLVVTPTGAMIKLHKDKSNPNSKDETLAQQKWDKVGDWIEIELRSTGGTATAQLNSGNTNMTLTASDDTFKVAKPTVVFRTVGGDALLDDVSVQVTKPGLISAVRKPAEN